MIFAKHKKVVFVIAAIVLLTMLGTSYKFVYEAGMDKVRGEQFDRLKEKEAAIAEYKKKQALIERQLAEARQERAKMTEERIREIRKSTDDCAGQRIPDDILRQLD